MTKRVSDNAGGSIVFLRLLELPCRLHETLIGELSVKALRSSAISFVESFTGSSRTHVFISG